MRAWCTETKPFAPRVAWIESPIDHSFQAGAPALSLQMSALGITNENEFPLAEPDPQLLTARAAYVGEPVTDNWRVAAHMGPAMRPPGQAPPDLPSLLLDGRIVYIGMPLVASVTELVISQLLWLNYADQEKPVYVYVNSTGSQTEDKQAVGFETEAYAILDTLNYIRPDVHTLAVGAAYGNAAMLLASGKKGCRAALPHARIKTNPPRLNRAMGPGAAMPGNASACACLCITWCIETAVAGAAFVSAACGPCVPVVHIYRVCLSGESRGGMCVP